MSQELDNSPEDFLRNIAEELTTISGKCTKIKQAQLTAATTDDLNNMGTSITSAVADKVNSLQSAIDSQSQTVNGALRLSQHRPIRRRNLSLPLLITIITSPIVYTVCNSRACFFYVELSSCGVI